MTTETPRVVYIAGYGRSGSTLLDIILHTHPDAVSVGALHNYPRLRTSGGSCGCGQPMPTCPFWSRVFAELDSSSGSVPELSTFLATQLKVERRTRILALLAGRQPRAVVNRYRSDHRELLEAIAEVAEVGTVIDSSKSAGETLGRPLALRRLLGADVRIVHLIRHPRGVLSSVLGGSGSGEERNRRSPVFLMLKTALQWSLVNLSCLVLYRGEGVVRLRYEDLVTNPADALAKVGELLELDLSDITDAIVTETPFRPGHNLGGNRLKQNREVVVRAPDSSSTGPAGVLGSVFDLLTLPARAVLGISSR